MSIFHRISTVIRSYINDLLGKCEDPAKMIDQTVLDLRQSLVDVKKELANLMAEEQSAKKNLEECQGHINRYTKAAESALRAGNEDDARKLIAAKQRHEEHLGSLQSAYDLVSANVTKLRKTYDDLVEEIKALEVRKDVAKVKVTAAKTQQHTNEIIAGTGTHGSSIAAFERMEAEADKMLNAALAEAELNTSTKSDEDLARKYVGNRSETVETELSAMKAALSQ